jgi:hypothetical protein
VKRAPGSVRTGTWIAGVACVLALAYITLNTLSSHAPGSKGPARGERLPPFAMPLALSRGPEFDADIATRVGQGNSHRLACDVRGPQILNSCQLAERGPVVLAFFATGDGRCVRQVGVLDRLAPRFPGVSFAAVAIKAKREDAAPVVRREGWRIPVGYDRDAAVTNLYAVAVCPLVTFARRGGVVAETTLGFRDAAQLTRLVRALGR